MAIDYLEVAKLAYEYLQMVGGICIFCRFCKRVLMDGNVDCEKYGLTRGALKCRSYEPRSREETTLYQAVGTTT
jgi:hypothetical protein